MFLYLNFSYFGTIFQNNTQKLDVATYWLYVGDPTLR